MRVERLHWLLRSDRYFVMPLRKRTDDATFLDRVSIGRATNKDIVLRHPSVSKFHAWFEMDDINALYLADADSTNGTLLNGKKLPPRELVRVNSADQVRVRLDRVLGVRSRPTSGARCATRAASVRAARRRAAAPAQPATRAADSARMVDARQRRAAAQRRCAARMTRCSSAGDGCCLHAVACVQTAPAEPARVRERCAGGASTRRRRQVRERAFARSAIDAGQMRDASSTSARHEHRSAS